MGRPAKLTEAEIQRKLEEIQQWTRTDNLIQRQFTLNTFTAAVGFINAIAICAEVADHHPDIRLYQWNKVEVVLSTHDQGGLTELDFALAAKIDAIGA